MITGDDPDQNASEEIKWDNKKVTTDKITDVEAKSVYSLMMRKGINVVKELEKNYNISNTSDLNRSQYMSIVKYCNNLPDKQG